VVAGAVVLVGAVVVGALAIAGGFGGGSGGGSSSSATRPTTPARSDQVQLALGPTSVQGPVLVTTFPAGVGDQVLDSLHRYVDDATVRALHTGRAGSGLAALADPGVTAQLAGPDRAVLVDEGLPKATRAVDVSSPAVPLTALVGADGKPLLVIATVQLDVTAATARGAVHIVRTGDLDFVPATDGTWQLTGYDLTVHRDGKGVPGGSEQTAGRTTTTGGGH
jgi:hypothetical protein